ncbi:hypothetical protein NXS19_000987 [Fusarium pseudograminearum]|nr:hypothetical protein NXS19_000987 [Fusarium pseudograminearum]
MLRQHLHISSHTHTRWEVVHAFPQVAVALPSWPRLVFAFFSDESRERRIELRKPMYLLLPGKRRREKASHILASSTDVLYSSLTIIMKVF